MQTSHLRSMGNVIMDHLSPDGCHGGQVLVWSVYVLVNGQGDVTSTGQEGAVISLPRNAHT